MTIQLFGMPLKTAGSSLLMLTKSELIKLNLDTLLLSKAHNNTHSLLILELQIIKFHKEELLYKLDRLYHLQLLQEQKSNLQLLS
jgi:hypothetical protein